MKRVKNYQIWLIKIKTYKKSPNIIVRRKVKWKYLKIKYLNLNNF